MYSSKGKRENDGMYVLGDQSPVGRAMRPHPKNPGMDISRQEDQDLLMTKIARGEALTSPAKDLPERYEPLFKHPLPISDHSAAHESNLRRVQCCPLDRQAMAAVTMGDAWALEAVFMNGAPVENPDPNGFYPIHLAVQLNNVDCIFTLINMKVNVNVTTLTGTTLLFLAIASNASECATLIKEHGGLYEVKNEEQISPMEFLEFGHFRDKSMLDKADHHSGFVQRQTHW